MSFRSELLQKLAKLNFCEKCYGKYLDLINPEIENLLSEPISDWRQTEHNIDVLWIKAKGLYDVNSIFSPHQNAFEKAKNVSVSKKMKFLKEKGIMKEHTYEFLSKVRIRRNKVHPPKKFSKKDYVLFYIARTLTGTLFSIIVFDLKEAVWTKQLDNIENYAKSLLENTKLF